MNIKIALKILRRQGFRVQGSRNNWALKGAVWTRKYSDRELIKMARTYTSEGQRTNVSKHVKWERNYKNRAKTKQLIQSGEYDRFPTNQLAADGNRWNWD